MAAGNCATGAESDAATTTVSVLNCVDSYLANPLMLGADEDAAAAELVESARAAMEALNVHLVARGKADTQH